MREAALWMMPRRLRHLFVRILIHCQPLKPHELWDEFKASMSEDYSRHDVIEIAQSKAYADISRMLSREGKSLLNFPSMEQIVDQNYAFEEGVCDNHGETGQRQYSALNQDQKRIVDTVIEGVTNRTGDSTHCFYIDGPGGSGKTFVYTTIYHLLSAMNKQVSCMAFTGIAAILLPHGKTVHRTYGLPVPMHAESCSIIKLHSNPAQQLKDTDVFIWDGARMAPRYALEIVDRTLRDIMNNNKPFGGKTVILGGDFRELLPVKMGGTRSEVVSLCIKYTAVWKHFQQFKLKQNMRVLPNEIEFTRFLLQVGDGVLNDSTDRITLPASVIAAPDVDMVTDMFGKIIRENNFDQLSKCAILAARNVDVDEINRKVVELLDPTVEHIYTSIDSVENCNDNDEIIEAILPEYLNSLSPPSLPPHELRLRKNAIVMLIRNISIHEGLCNGTRLRVLEFSNHLLKCEILNGDNAKEIVFLNRITLYCEDKYPFTFKRRQFPVKLAFAMTINKAQGQTFERIGIDLRRDVFSHGQLYVALSRVKSQNGLRVYLNKTGTNGTKVKNYVYKELYAE